VDPGGLSGGQSCPGDDNDTDDSMGEEEEEGEVEEDEEEDEDEDNGKEPWTIGEGEMVNTLADDIDTMVHNKLIVLPEQGQEMRENTARPQPPAPAPTPQTLETQPLSRLEHLGHVTPQKSRPVVPTLREAEEPSNTLDVDVDVDVDQ